ncbi:u16-Sparatoxin-Hju1a_1 [Caerostris darwini]|uniref:U16-Sparatoxin-Hju1a_1 n=1 Tax=Caerostris darwini TaxID=1538125 RepID=A0AAV4NXK7_9ARAC|nr:u16-Sparatoxin-Hju1a_1 [Caerostris darwini]
MWSFNKRYCSAIVFIAMFCSCALATSRDMAGCHMFGHTRTVKINGCVQFTLTTNACRGFCPSYSTPSPEWIKQSNPKQVIWSVAQCCNIMETEDCLLLVYATNDPPTAEIEMALSCSNNCIHLAMNAITAA